jgi:ABC-type sulfate transport system permease component
VGDRALHLPGKKLVDALIDLPFVVRTVQPILEDLDVELEEAAVRGSRVERLAFGCWE